MVSLAVMIGIVVGLSQIVKTIGLQTKYIPLLNLTLGNVLGVLFLDGDAKTNVFQGIIIGLSASGLFDHTKIMKKDTEMKKTLKHISSESLLLF